MANSGDKSREIRWPDSGPYQPDPNAFKGTERSGFQQAVIPGEAIMPGTVDPQTIPSGTPGNS